MGTQHPPNNSILMIPIIFLVFTISSISSPSVKSENVQQVVPNSYQNVSRVEIRLLKNALKNSEEFFEEVGDDIYCNSKKVSNCVKALNGKVAACIGSGDFGSCIAAKVDEEGRCYPCLCGVIDLLGALPKGCSCHYSSVTCLPPREGHRSVPIYDYYDCYDYWGNWDEYYCDYYDYHVPRINIEINLF